MSAHARDLGYLIKRAQQAVRNALDPAIADLGLTTAQYATLYNLARHPGASNAELARLSFVTPQTMIRIVSDLQRRGLLRRVPSPAHGRVLQAQLSEAGRALLARAQRRVDRIHEQMLTGLTEIDVQHLAAGLLHVATVLEGTKTTTRMPARRREE